MNLRINAKMSESTDFSAGSNKYLESNVRFSFKYAQSDKKCCIKKFDKNELIGLYKTLGEKENLTWSQFRGLPREKGLSIEKKDSNNHKILCSLADFSTFGHIRVKVAPNGRIFGAIQRDLFYIILLDRDGALNH